MQTAVGAEYPEGTPAFVHIRGSCLLKSADIMAPESEAGAGQGKSAPQRFRHGRIGGGAVSSPVYRELLTACRGRPGEENGFSLSPLPHQQFEYRTVVKIGVKIVHFHRIRVIVIHHVPHRYPFSEIRLEAVHAHIQQGFQFLLIPCTGRRIGKVHDSHACLPQIRLPYTAVPSPDQISALHGLPKQRGFLADIGIDPHTDLQSPVMIPFQHGFWIRKCFGIPLEITPLVSVHPVTVKVEHMQGNLAFLHPPDKVSGGLLVIVGGKRSRQPQAERPGRRKRRFSGQLRIFLDGSLGCAAADQIVVQPLSLHGKLHPLHLLTGHLESRVSFVVHQHAVTLAGNIERNIFVGNLTGGSSVLVPHLHSLSVANKRSEPFAHAVNQLVHIDGQLFRHISLSAVPVLHIRHIPPAAVGEPLLAVIVSDRPGGGLSGDLRPQGSALINKLILLFPDNRRNRLCAHRHKRAVIAGAVKMGDGDMNHIFHGTCETNSEKSAVETIPPVVDMAVAA